jgi:ABC-type bacteriocin/lantibiotic exporter with double-glycine peptidase domain
LRIPLNTKECGFDTFNPLLNMDGFLVVLVIIFMLLVIFGLMLLFLWRIEKRNNEQANEGGIRAKISMDTLIGLVKKSKGWLKKELRWNLLLVFIFENAT